MIYTVTLNPALDYVMTLENCTAGEVNRSTRESLVCGGKGINVSAVLDRLDAENVALGFIAGETGDIFEKKARESGINTELIRLKSGNTRINVKLNAKHTTEINAVGPPVGRESTDMLFERLSRLAEGDILVLCGSVPPSLPADIYRKLMESLEGKGICTVADTSGKALMLSLEQKPFLIKPNISELKEVTDFEISDRADIVRAAARLHDKGAANVLVSMGANGAMLYGGDGEVYFCNAPVGKAINTVGAGDSALAGFIAGYSKGMSVPDALRLAVAAGSASAFSDGFAKKEEIYDLYGKLTVQKYPCYDG